MKTKKLYLLVDIYNQIKVIKRIVFGYQNFTHFRNRIMYIINNGVTASQTCRCI